MRLGSGTIVPSTVAAYGFALPAGMTAAQLAATPTGNQVSAVTMLEDLWAENYRANAPMPPGPSAAKTAWNKAFNLAFNTFIKAANIGILGMNNPQIAAIMNGYQNGSSYNQVMSQVASLGQAPVGVPASLPTVADAMQIVPVTQASPGPVTSSPTMNLGPSSLAPTATGLTSGPVSSSNVVALPGVVVGTTSPATYASGGSAITEQLQTDDTTPSIEAQVVGPSGVSPLVMLAGLAAAYFLLAK